MCELFGLSSRDKIGVNEYLRAFFRHSEQHPHGWGLAQFFGNAVQLEKEPVAAVESQYLTTRLSFPIQARSLIAHIRLASVGRLRYENCHPFVLRDIDGRAWTFAHNGTIFSPKRASGASIDDYKDTQLGGTDSERVLLYLIDRINERRMKLGRHLEAEDRFTLLDEVIAELSHDNKLNLLIWDGEYLYAHTNYADTLFTKKIPETGSLLIATKPIDSGAWEHVPFLQLQVYKDGETIWQGHHKSEQFFDHEKNWEYRNIDFAVLSSEIRQGASGPHQGHSKHMEVLCLPAQPVSARRTDTHFSGTRTVMFLIGKIFTKKIPGPGLLLIATRPIDDAAWEHVTLLQLQV